ncbi:unnamed protein product [Boreogadus saida]
MHSGELLIIICAKQHVQISLWLLSGMIWLVTVIFFRLFPHLHSSGFKCKGLKFDFHLQDVFCGQELEFSESRIKGRGEDAHIFPVFIICSLNLPSEK